jgi:hypothetical protein
LLERADTPARPGIAASPARAACAILAAGSLFPPAEQPLAALLPATSPPELAGQLGRMDRLCALSVCATERAIADLWNPRRGADARSLRTGLLLGTAQGCHKVDEDYYRSVAARQASPRLFSYTLPSSPLGELSILYELRGPGLAIVTGRTAGLEALAEAQALLRDDRVDACLVIAAEVGAPAIPAMPDTAADQLVDGAVALLLVRADAVPGTPTPAPLGYLLGTGTGYRVDQPAAALRVAAPRAAEDAALPIAALPALPVLCDETTAGWLAAAGLGVALQPSATHSVASQKGAVAGLQAVLAAAAGAAPQALILSGDADGQAAAALWARQR